MLGLYQVLNETREMYPEGDRVLLIFVTLGEGGKVEEYLAPVKGTLGKQIYLLSVEKITAAVPLEVILDPLSKEEAIDVVTLCRREDGRIYIPASLGDEIPDPQGDNWDLPPLEGTVHLHPIQLVEITDMAGENLEELLALYMRVKEEEDGLV